MRSVALWFTLASVACAPRYRLPMTSEELAGHRRVGGLVAYLGQPDASPAVCEAGAEATRSTEERELAPALVSALRDGDIAPPLWAGCVSALLGWLDEVRASELVSSVLDSETDLLLDRRVEAEPPLEARLAALHRTYVEREPGAGPAARGGDEALRRVRQALAARQLGPVAERYGSELVRALELERGGWQGQAVTAAILDDMAEAGGEALLLVSARRLPDPALRAIAERRVIRLRIARSAFPYVRASAAAVEEAVMRLGSNPVSLVARPALRASVDAGRLAERRILVTQDVQAQRATMLGTSAERAAPAVLPDLALRGALDVALSGLGPPIAICAAGRALDPTPCIAPGDVRSGSSLARVDRATLRLASAIAQTDAAALARFGSVLDVPLLVGGVPLAHLSWPVSFSRPADLVLAGSSFAGAGPELRVEVERLATGPLVYAVSTGAQTLLAVVEWADAASFRVISRGAPGMEGGNGGDGTDGTRGTDGTSATCPSFSATNGSPGSPGSPGGRGGDGGPGGPGGAIAVIVSGPPALRDETLALVRAMIASEGGAGGAGGRGGRGGRGGEGGSGGSGTTCTDPDGRGATFLSSGQAGSPGMDGSDGWDGDAGRPGAPGPVVIEWRDVP